MVTLQHYLLATASATFIVLTILLLLRQLRQLHLIMSLVPDTAKLRLTYLETALKLGILTLAGLATVGLVTTILNGDMMLLFAGDALAATIMVTRIATERALKRRERRNRDSPRLDQAGED